jgi:arylsulfatase A-like enzyme
MDAAIPFENWPLSPEFYEPRSEYWDVPLMRDDEIVERPAQQESLTRRYTEEAVAFIEANAERPFFLYLPHTMVHIPLFRDQAFAGQSRAGIYGDVVEEIDWSVGQILETLDRLGLDDDTLVVFTSDNGPWTVFREHGGTAGLLRMGKGTTFEGGMRVPAIFRWPGRIAPGVVRDIGSTLDLFATIMALAGGEPPPGRTLDSFDLSATLLESAESPRETMFYYRYDELYAIRKGEYKLHFITQGEYGEGPDRTEHDPPLLYHLEHDPSERFDLAAAHPEVVADLLAEAEAHRNGLDLPESQFDTRTTP